MSDVLDKAQTRDFKPESAKVPPRQPREAQYLVNQVGPALQAALASIVMQKPQDPIEYLAHYLQKHADTLAYQAMVSATDIFDCFASLSFIQLLITYLRHVFA